MTTTNSSNETDFRAPPVSRKLPRAVADGRRGVIIATADVAGSPDRVFRALTTNEVESWWAMPGVYRQKEWTADLRVCGAWSVVVEMAAGGTVHAAGEFCSLEFPNEIIMTRRFLNDAHPFLGPRETTITYCLDPSPYGTLVTVRDEGFIGRRDAAYGNAEIWEKVVGWLDAYLSRD
jgi:uncharacterized protein YndB with AHSA1/START domain